MTWTHLLPEAGQRPADLVAANRAPLPPADATAVSLEDAVRLAGSTGATSTIRTWPLAFRRIVAMGVHLSAVHNARAGWAPTDGPVQTMPVLVDERIRWSRSDLAWALREADDYGSYDGAGFILPGLMAASLSATELAGFEPALQAVFDDFIDQRDTPRPVRRRLAELYGTAIGRSSGRLPPDLLPATSDFGEFVRLRLGERLDEPGVADLLRHATALRKAIPTKTWLRAAGGFPTTWPVRTVLERFVDYNDYVHPANDDLLRGLTWMLSLDSSDRATELLDRVAITAGAAGPDWPGHPLAPLTAAAAVEIMSDRPGDLPPWTLKELARTVTNKALLTRVQAALP